MPHKPWITTLAWAIFTLFALASDSNAQETLQPHAPPILHSFLDSANVYPESVTVDQSSGTFFVGSVKEGTIYKGKIARTAVSGTQPPVLPFWVTQIRERIWSGQIEVPIVLLKKYIERPNRCRLLSLTNFLKSARKSFSF